MLLCNGRRYSLALSSWLEQVMSSANSLENFKAKEFGQYHSRSSHMMDGKRLYFDENIPSQFRFDGIFLGLLC